MTITTTELKEPAEDMAKKATKVEELVELVKEEKVTQLLVDRLTQTLSPAIDEILERKLDEILEKKLDGIIEKKLDKIIDRILNKLNPFVEKNITAQITAHTKKLQNKQNLLEDEIDRLQNKVDRMEAEARLPNLVICGLQEVDTYQGSKGSAEKEATEAVLLLCNETLGLSVDERDIESAYRLPKRGKETHRSLVVKFRGMKTRNLVYGARFTLNKSRTYINEHLSSQAAQTYAKARSLMKEGKVLSTWTMGGVVYLRTTEKPGDKPLKIHNVSTLKKLLQIDDLPYMSEEGAEKSHLSSSSPDVDSTLIKHQ